MDVASLPQMHGISLKGKRGKINGTLTSLSVPRRLTDQMLPYGLLAVDGKTITLPHQKTDAGTRTQANHPFPRQHGTIIVLMRLEPLISFVQAAIGFHRFFVCGQRG